MPRYFTANFTAEVLEASTNPVVLSSNLVDVSDVTDIRSENWGGGEHGHGVGRTRQPPHRPHILVLLCPLKLLRAGIGSDSLFSLCVC